MIRIIHKFPLYGPAGEGFWEKWHNQDLNSYIPYIYLYNY